jgi:hypothetical protein
VKLKIDDFACPYHITAIHFAYRERLNMQLSDFQVILLVTPIIGYLAGFMTVKINYLLVIVSGKLWTSGHAKKRFIVTGITVTACYITIIMMIFDFTTINDQTLQMIPAIITIVFAGLYAVGIFHSDMRFKDTDTVMNNIIMVTYATGNSPLEIQIRKDTQNNAKSILDGMPISNNHALRLLLFVFDSAMMVFLVSLSKGRFRVRRFVNLGSTERKEYFETWATNEYLYYAVQALKSLVGFSYYTSPGTWTEIGYNGKLLSRSYWN